MHYAQRNVRGLAFLISGMSEEDVSSSSSESITDDDEPTDDAIDAKPSNANEVAEANEASTSNNDESRILPPTSTGRKRFKPVKLDL